VSAGEALCDFEAGTYKYPGKRLPKREYVEKASRYAWEMRNNQNRWQQVPDSHEHRRHNPDTTERFGLYRRLTRRRIPSSVFGLAARTRLAGGVRTEVVRKFLSEHGLRKTEVPGLAEQVVRLPTRKHSQQVLDPQKPSPTVLTIPDDLVHPDEDRVMTVRELARLQSFPDWFEFRGKMTTGGTQRKTEVPRYTQVGNAVPPLLAKAIGVRLRALLS